jgi:tetratricopeptide (TPR) repeat protein
MKSGRILVILGILALVVCAVQPAMAATERDNATENYNIAEAAINLGDYERAVRYFDMALADNITLISMSDTRMYIYKDKAAALADLGRYDDALKTANEGLVLFKNASGMWNNKGYILFKMGRYSDAVEAYTQAVTVDPSYVKGWINKGDALSATGRYSEAIEAYNTALNLDPGNTGATTGLTSAQNAAASTSQTMITILVLVVIVAAGVAVWYIKFRKPDSGDKPEKNTEKDKKNK